MNKRGPKPVPTAILRLRGSPLAANRTGEPEPLAGEPTMPDELDDEAVAEWRRTTEALRGMGLLSYVDRSMLAALCIAWSRFWRAYRDEKALPATTTWQSKAMAGNVADKALAAYCRLASAFGLSPAARTQLKAAPTLPVTEDGRIDFTHPDAPARKAVK